MRNCLAGFRHVLVGAARRVGVVGVTFVLWSAEAQAQTAGDAAGSELGAEGPGQGKGAELRAELDSYIGSALQAFNVPGAAVAVLVDGKVAYRNAFGSRSARRARPVGT